MNYSKIEELQKQKKVSNRKLSKAIGMSDVGYGKMLANKSCDVATIEAIAKYFKIPLTYFFDLEENQERDPSLKNFNCPECIQKQKTIDELTSERDELRVELLELYRDKKSPGKCG